MVIPHARALRLFGVAAILLVSYGVLLARFERVTLSSVIRALRHRDQD
jgi:hypothetical protein